MKNDRMVISSDDGHSADIIFSISQSELKFFIKENTSYGGSPEMHTNQKVKKLQNSCDPRKTIEFPDVSTHAPEYA